jgi:hypothetical protein
MNIQQKYGKNMTSIIPVILSNLLNQEIHLLETCSGFSVSTTQQVSLLQFRPLSSTVVTWPPLFCQHWTPLRFPVKVLLKVKVTHFDLQPLWLNFLLEQMYVLGVHDIS